jgi:hypothetical protein
MKLGLLGIEALSDEIVHMKVKGVEFVLAIR